MKQALLIIDMVNGMEQWISKRRIRKIIPNLEKLIKKCKENKIPIYYIVHKPLGKKGTKFYSKIAPKGDKIIYKNYYSSFYRTGLHRALKNKRIKNLLITGLSTHWCVLATALSAYYRNYKITIVKDCVTAPTDADNRWALHLSLIHI